MLEHSFPGVTFPAKNKVFRHGDDWVFGPSLGRRPWLLSVAAPKHAAGCARAGAWLWLRHGACSHAGMWGHSVRTRGE